MSTRYTSAIGYIVVSFALLMLGLTPGEAVAQVEDTTGQAMEQEPTAVNELAFSDAVILHVFMESNRGEIVTSEVIDTPEMREEDPGMREDPETMEYPETREDPETVEDTARVVSETDTVEVDTTEADTTAVGGEETTVVREEEEETFAEEEEAFGEEMAGDARSDSVQAFAQRMTRDHGDALQEAAALALQLNVQPQPNLVSTMLAEGAQGTAEDLRMLTGEELHREYMLAQITMHQQTLDLLEHTLIPNAESEELVNLLEEARTTVERHLDQALTIYQEMAPGTS